MAIISVKTRNSPTRVALPEFIFIIICCWYYILPVASSKVDFITMLGICALYTYFAFQVIPVRYAKDVIKLIMVSAIIAAAYYLFTETVTISKDSSFYELKRFLSKFSQVFFGFFPLLILARLQYAATRKQKIVLILVMFGMIAFTVFTTWSEIMIYARAARAIDYVGGTGKNVGGYSFVYAISALIPVLMIVFYYAKNTVTKGCVICVILILFAFLIRAQYSLAIIIALIGMVLFVMTTSKNDRFKVLLVVVGVGVFMILPSILDYMVAHMEISDVTIRLTEISNALSGEGLGYNMNGRFTLYWKSIEAFLHSPIWGNRKLDFDGHATLLTVLSDVGLIGSVPYYYAYFSSRKRVLYLLDDYDAYTKYRPVFICFILMGYTNPIHSTLPIYIVVWLLAPLLVDILSSPSARKTPEYRERRNHD